jgi:uncharacterized delta-60 repeat protein
MALQSDGKIIVAGLAGGAFGVTAFSAFALARYNADGSLDGTFGGGGKVFTEFQGASPAVTGTAAQAVAVQPDGAIVVAGRSDSCENFALARYNPDGSPDVSFGKDGRVGTAFSQSCTIHTGDGFYSLALQPDGKIVAAGMFSGAFALARYAGGPGRPPSLAAAVLPSSRSVRVNSLATAFATIVNGGATTAVGCGIAVLSGLFGPFTYQTTDSATNQLTGTPNTPVDIPSGRSESFVLAFRPTSAMAPRDIQLSFRCTNTDAAPILTGVSTLFLSASTSPVPDIVALAATQLNDGIVRIPGVAATGVFAVATVNVGAPGSITVSPDTGGRSLPLTLSVCRTDPPTGVCLDTPSDSVTAQINANETPTFGIFATGNGSVPFDPAHSRIVVRFKDAGGVTRGSTSVAAQTQSARLPSSGRAQHVQTSTHAEASPATQFGMRWTILTSL